MATSSPPRFVPTLTETAHSVSPQTTVEDTSYFEKRDPVDSMLDLDLSDLEAPISRIEHVSPLGAYQQGSGRVRNPQAVNHAPVAHTAAHAHSPHSHSHANTATPSAYTTRPAVAAPTATLQSMLPADWQNQMQALVQQAVRQELQQQMPFLLLQWSKQIEDKLTPHIHQQLVKLVHDWQAPAN